MQELYNDSGILGGVGQFQVTGGSLSGDFVPATGEIVEITFQVVPASIDDFQQNFAFVSNLTLTPVPEPATICLLGLGGLALLRKRRA
ncbi:MAG: PEP-CTERM sorting domain-containing protein [Candidatus Scalindua sp.]|nr:PEP-CTERM sorting domain-containing protein [Candidatus Scalindua sp.]